MNALLLVLVMAAAPVQAQSPAMSADAQSAMKKGILAAQAQDYPLAIRLLEDARKLAPQAPELHYNLGLAESKLPGRELRAMAWFAAYLAANPAAPNAAVVREQIDALDVKNQLNVSRLMKTVQEAASRLPGDKYEQMSNVAELWMAAGDARAAMKAADLVTDAFYRGSAQQDVAWAQIEAGDFAGALKTAERIDFSYWKASSLLAVGEKQFAAGDVAGAKKTLAAARKTADGIDRDADFGIEGKDSKEAQMLNRIAQAQAKGGDVSGAEKTAGDITNPDFMRWKGEALTAIAVAQTRLGDAKGASKTLAKALEASGGPYGRVELLSGIAKGQHKNGDVEGARATLATARAVAEKLEAGYRIRAYAALASAEAATGDVPAGLKTAELVLDGYWKSLALSEIAEMQFAGGDRAGARKTLVRARETADPLDGGLKDFATAQIARVETAGGAGAPKALVVPASEWVTLLDGALNGEPFLDLAGHLETLARSGSDSPGTVFRSLHDTAKQIVDAQNVAHEMLKRGSTH